MAKTKTSLLSKKELARLDQLAKLRITRWNPGEKQKLIEAYKKGYSITVMKKAKLSDASYTRIYNMLVRENVYQYGRMQGGNHE